VLVVPLVGLGAVVALVPLTGLATVVAVVVLVALMPLVLAVTAVEVFSVTGAPVQPARTAMAINAGTVTAKFRISVRCIMTSQTRSVHLTES
jgi:hypothetical protein